MPPFSTRESSSASASQTASAVARTMSAPEHPVMSAVSALSAAAPAPAGTREGSFFVLVIVAVLTNGICVTTARGGAASGGSLCTKDGLEHRPGGSGGRGRVADRGGHAPQGLGGGRCGREDPEGRQGRDRLRCSGGSGAETHGSETRGERGRGSSIAAGA